MRQDDDPAEGNKHDWLRKRRSAMGFVLLLAFLALYIWEVPREHNHVVHEVFTIGGALWSAHMMDEGITERFLDRGLAVAKRFVPGFSDSDSTEET